jgi:hypothetical protein
VNFSFSSYIGTFRSFPEIQLGFSGHFMNFRRIPKFLDGSVSILYYSYVKIWRLNPTGCRKLPTPPPWDFTLQYWRWKGINQCYKQLNAPHSHLPSHLFKISLKSVQYVMRSPHRSHARSTSMKWRIDGGQRCIPSHRHKPRQSPNTSQRPDEPA